MRIIVVDIEKIPNRYSAQWLKWHGELFESNDIEWVWVGYDTVVDTKPNEFLSFIPSNLYKAMQVQELAVMLDNDKIEEGDFILFMDAWHPGAIQVRQMLLSYNKHVKMAGFWHAGSYDPNDMLGRHRKYFLNFEKALHDCYDYNLFATKFSRTLFEFNLAMASNDVYQSMTCKNHVVGFLYDVSHLEPKFVKENIILFPHRIAPEKRPFMFNGLINYARDTGRLKDYEFIKTMEVCGNKDEYHELLCRSKFALSFAIQETFGIAMIESLYAGAIPVVPKGLSYDELYPEECRYDPLKKSAESIYSEICDMIEGFEVERTSARKKAFEMTEKYINGAGLIEFLEKVKVLC